MSSKKTEKKGSTVTNKPQITVHSTKSLVITLYDVKWVPSSARFVVVGNYMRGTGAIQVYELNHGQINTVAEFEKHSALKCGTFAASSLEERHLATGDFDGRVSLWNLERMDSPVWTAKVHSAIINSIDGCGGINMTSSSPEIVTGSRDGKVMVWDPRTTTPVASFAQTCSQVRDCWAVCFGNSYEDERCICAGFENGDLKMFDLKMNKMRWETNTGAGICSIEFDRKDIEMNKLLVSMLNAKFNVYDLRTLNAKQGYAFATTEAHGATVWTGRHLPQNRDIWATTGGDGSINLYKYSYPAERRKKMAEGEEYIGIIGTVEQLNSTNITTQPIISFDWNADFEGLCAIGGLDQSVRVGLVTKLKSL